MLLQLTNLHGQTIWINEDKIEMIEPSRSQGIGSFIYINDKRVYEVKETPIQVLEMIRK